MNSSLNTKNPKEEDLSGMMRCISKSTLIEHFQGSKDCIIVDELVHRNGNARSKMTGK